MATVTVRRYLTVPHPSAEEGSHLGVRSAAWLPVRVEVRDTVAGEAPYAAAIGSHRVQLECGPERLEPSALGVPVARGQAVCADVRRDACR
jgi:hypothetical protein